MSEEDQGIDEKGCWHNFGCLFRRVARNRWEKLRASSRPYLERMNGDTILRVFVDLGQNEAL